ncbi:MAG: hypothetical protein HQL44_01885 [Alphaproteobacteria bacterium]|nr:hypothetical protein [Alphaproteobacteria bacterium]
MKTTFFLAALSLLTMGGIAPVLAVDAVRQVSPQLLKERMETLPVRPKSETVRTEPVGSPRQGESKVEDKEILSPAQDERPNIDQMKNQ